jgi:hypothetical protein
VDEVTEAIVNRRRLLTEEVFMTKTKNNRGKLCKIMQVIKPFKQ